MSVESGLTMMNSHMWEAHGEAALLGGGLVFDCRMVVIDLGDGGLLLYSPVVISDALKDAIDALGEVRLIVAPNLFHFLFAAKAKETWPEAKLIGPKGLSKKAPSVKLDGLHDELPALLDGTALSTHEIAGAKKIREVVLIDDRTKTLVCSDLCFNIQEPKGWAAPIVFRLVGCHKCVGTSRLWLSVVTDRDALRASLRDLYTKDFDAVIMSHGRPLVAGGKAALKQSTLTRFGI